MLVSNRFTVCGSHIVLNIVSSRSSRAYSLTRHANGRGKQNKELINTLETTSSFSEVSRTWRY